MRRLIKNDFENVFNNVDVILLPTSPTPAFKQGENLSDPLKMYLSDIFTTQVSLTGLPALNFPAGETKNKLPIGLQLIGNYFKEETILNFSHYIEKTLILIKCLNFFSSLGLNTLNFFSIFIFFKKKK